MANYYTVEQLLIRAMQDLGIGAAGEPVDPDDLIIALGSFNDTVDDFKADVCMIYQTIMETFPLTAGTNFYTIGPGGTWNMVAKPQIIVKAGYVNTYVNPTEPLETAVHVYTDEEWAAIGLKTLTSTIIWGIWYETSFSGSPTPGLGRVFVYPIITTGGNIALYVPVPIDEVAADESGYATTLYIPPAYRKLFRTSVAIDIAGAFEMEPPPSLVKKHADAVRRVTRANAKPMTLRLPKALTRRSRTGGFNILTNQ